MRIVIFYGANFGRMDWLLPASAAPDTVYSSTLLATSISQMTWDGNMTVSQRISCEARDLVRELGKDDPSTIILKQAVENRKLVVEVKLRRVGGANYQVPIEVRVKRRTRLGLRCLTGDATARSENDTAEKLCAEAQDGAACCGSALKKGDVHLMGGSQQGFRSLSLVRGECKRERRADLFRA